MAIHPLIHADAGQAEFRWGRHSGSTQTVAGASVGVADAALEVDVASSSLRDRPHNEHNMGSVKTDKRQRTNQAKPVVNSDFDKPLSIAESAGQTLAPTAVSGSSLPDLNKNGAVTVDISNFMATKILDKRPSPSGVKYRCELEPL